MDPSRRYPRLSLPYTVLTGPDTVRLVAGEDFRYTLTAPGLEQWLPRLLASLDGKRSLGELLDGLDQPRREPARQLLVRLYGERVLIDSTAQERHVAHPCRLVVEGTGTLADGLRKVSCSPAEAPGHLLVLCQDRLDYDELLCFNRRCRDGQARWMWVSSGAMQRGYVSPIIWPDAGPCLTCLVRQFQRLSPAPEIYDHLVEHARQGMSIEPVLFPAEGREILQQLVLWKWSLLQQAESSAALYRLQVLEIATLEVTSHRVFADPECPDCAGQN